MEDDFGKVQNKQRGLAEEECWKKTVRGALFYEVSGDYGVCY